MNLKKGCRRHRSSWAGGASERRPCTPFPTWQATFGSLPAFLTLGALLLEFVLGMATTARGFSKYLARLINQPSDLFIITYGDDGAIDYMVCTAAALLRCAQ